MFIVGTCMIIKNVVNVLGGDRKLLLRRFNLQKFVLLNTLLKCTLYMCLLHVFLTRRILAGMRPCGCGVVF